MFKIKRKSTLLLILLGAVVGSLGVTSASAEKAILVNTGKNVDALIHKVDMRKLGNLNSTLDDSVSPHKFRQGDYQTFKLEKPLKITDIYRHKHKSTTLPKGSIVAGYSDGKGNLTSISNTSLSIKNQKLVFKTLKNWNRSLPVSNNNGGAQHPYTKANAFSYNSLALCPFLSVKSNNPISNAEGLTLPFVSISADSQLVYHTKGSQYKPTRYAKIKKFKLTRSSITSV
ncbi:hypothetical protein [Levilactobacillus paucivorans]|uniref:hypothetical protein n=1 Tax=Levilactobacillus paucivorans TaxID=616990 RepID=UPI000709DAC0|nr:hypothetical protein [Levilactobacillus paucivorans]